MVIKIMKSTPNFSCIAYNENKNEQGKSQLLRSGNMETISVMTANPSRKTYINYMEYVASMNPRVKNKSFHTVISCKGNEFTPDQLADLGVSYLEKMGYVNSPYLIYAHNDTKNNHVHLVASRVDLDGNKISDSYEKIRSQEFLRDLGLAQKVNPDRAFQMIQSYKFSTPGQLLALLQSQGYKAHVTGSKGIKIVNNGRTVADWNEEEVMCLIKIPDNKRAKQLAQIFEKYSNGQGWDSFSNLVKEKLGVELVPHFTKDGSKIFGYTVLDHSKRNLFKGSEIYPLSNILKAEEKPNRETIQELVKKAQTFTQMKNSLKELNCVVSKEGEITHSGSLVGMLNERKIQEFNSTQKRELIQSIILGSADNKSILSKAFNVPDSFTMGNSIDGKKAATLDSKIKSLLLNRDLEGLEKLHFYNHAGKIYALDFKSKQFSELETKTEQALKTEGVKPRTLGGKQRITESKFQAIQSKTAVQTALASLTQVLNQKYGQGERDRSKRRNQNQNL